MPANVFYNERALKALGMINKRMESVGRKRERTEDNETKTSR